MSIASYDLFRKHCINIKTYCVSQKQFVKIDINEGKVLTYKNNCKQASNIFIYGP